MFFYRWQFGGVFQTSEFDLSARCSLSHFLQVCFRILVRDVWYFTLNAQYSIILANSLTYELPAVLWKPEQVYSVSIQLRVCLPPWLTRTSLLQPIRTETRVRKAFEPIVKPPILPSQTRMRSAWEMYLSGYSSPDAMLCCNCWTELPLANPYHLVRSSIFLVWIYFSRNWCIIDILFSLKFDLPFC